MKWILRIPQTLLTDVRVDLRRSHPVAAERVGFIEGRCVDDPDETPIFLASRFHPVVDADYLDDPRVGARIGGNTIRQAMQRVLDGKNDSVGMLHVHMHHHAGMPRFSSVDRREIPRLVASFRSVGPTALHGALLLSTDHLTGFIWCPGDDAPSESGKIVVVGRPLGLSQGGGLYA